MALSWTMDKIGPMCRSVEDCALIFAAIAGPDNKDSTVTDAPFRWSPSGKMPDVRVGVDVEALSSVKRGNRERRKVYEAAISTLSDLGFVLQPVRLPKQTPAYRAIAGLTINVEGAASFAVLSASGGLEQLVQQADYSWPNTFRVGSTIPATEYLQAQRVRAQLQRAMADALRDVDLYVTIPNTGSPSLVYTNLTGHPELVTRAGMHNGLPLSISFVGQLYREDLLCRVAHAFERATPWHTQWPDVDKLPETPIPERPGITSTYRESQAGATRIRCGHSVRKPARLRRPLRRPLSRCSNACGRRRNCRRPGAARLRRRFFWPECRRSGRATRRERTKRPPPAPVRSRRSRR
jgi:Asp-tRNA(Asn)/Glu-tRNA(Gln) amidotransferase A subunit family amidase